MIFKLFLLSPSHSEHSDAHLWYIGSSLSYYWLKQIFGYGFHVGTIVLRFLLCQISCSNFRLDRSFKQVYRHYCIFDSHQFPLNFILQFSFANPTFLPICYCAMVQTLSKLHEHELFCLRKKCDSVSDRLHAALEKDALSCS